MLQQSKIILFLVLVLLGSNFLFATPSPLPREQAVSITPSTAVVSTDPQALCCSFQRKTFFAEGIYWLFYSDGSNIECVTSPDALAWSQPTSIASSGGDGNLWSTWVNATSNTLFYARVSGSLFFYRFGTLSSLGCAQISWQIPETSESPANLGKRTTSSFRQFRLKISGCHLVPPTREDSSTSRYGSTQDRGRRRMISTLRAQIKKPAQFCLSHQIKSGCMSTGR